MADFHWADQVANEIIKRKREIYVCSSGVTPSGTVHIGNFREIITVDLVVRALKDKKVKFLFYWDDYDRLRKIPVNIPKEFEKFIGMPISDIKDPFKCHKSYAEHFEKELEESLPFVGIRPRFVRQSERYKNCDYADEIRTILRSRATIKDVLNKYRKEPLDGWWPLAVYCEKCKKDFTKITDYDEDYKITYVCSCGFKDVIDFRKKGIVKLPWRIQWECWWNYEKVDFEPGGKDHYTQGGSRITANEIFEKVYRKQHPVDLKYDFISLKGKGGKMSSSLGNVIRLKDVLEVYEPEIVRYIFASTRPNTEFFISFDEDVIKVYEDFDRLEESYFAKKISEKDKRVYELSCVKEVLKKKPDKIGFRHLTILLQIQEENVNKIVKKYGKQNKKRAECALNWLEKYAPDNYKFKLQEKVNVKLNEKEKEALKLLAGKLEEKSWKEKDLFNEFYEICKKVNIENIDFFKAAYKVLINKEKGPKLAPFILAIGKDKVIKLLRQI